MQATQDVISRVPLCTEAEFNEAVQAAKAAFPSWSKSAIGTRARVMFKLQQLIWENKVGRRKTRSGVVNQQTLEPRSCPSLPAVLGMHQ